MYLLLLIFGLSTSSPWLPQINPGKRIVLFKSLRNCKKRNRGNITLKSNPNKMMLCWGGGKYHLVLIKISA